MTHKDDSAEALVEMLERKAPETLDLLTAESEQDFEKAFEALLNKAVTHLEANSKNFRSLDETGITAVVAGVLSMPGLTITQETNSNGHVDLKIDMDHCSPPRIKLGEAKIYNGYEYHVGGLGQLLGRYSTGREGRGLLLVYVKKKDIAALMDRLRKDMDTRLPLQQQGETVDHGLKWSFVSAHKHSSGENLEVGHIAFNLYFEQPSV
ncbi:hypothetical protein [Anaerobaca lacustris]|uniref:Uncharacterized protein n=1 Tax=Anaerobaca lacustris TaxID=3044600 RepID=A0AAW6U332_9BACT|nr:hypothetical protein [Sedimentisphaerales bacterium M17dextr]